MNDGVSHLINVRDKPGFLRHLMVKLAGDARISLEGDLSRCQFPDNLVVSREPVGILKRNTLVPKQDFVVLRLTAESIGPIFEQVVSAGLARSIVHVQIERNGLLELGAYDNLHSSCVVTGPSISPVLLEELRAKTVLRSFRSAAANQS